MIVCVPYLSLFGWYGPRGGRRKGKKGRNPHRYGPFVSVFGAGLRPAEEKRKRRKGRGKKEEAAEMANDFGPRTPAAERGTRGPEAPARVRFLLVLLLLRREKRKKKGGAAGESSAVFLALHLLGEGGRRHPS